MCHLLSTPSVIWHQESTTKHQQCVIHILDIVSSCTNVEPSWDILHQQIVSSVTNIGSSGTRNYYIAGAACSVPCVTCQVSHAKCHMADVKCQVSPAKCHIPGVTCCFSHTLTGMWHFTCGTWLVTLGTWHLPCDTSHVAPSMWCKMVLPLS